MSIRVLFIILLAFLIADGPGDGRKGNALYKEGKYAEAADAYRQGLEALGSAPSEARYGLLNNLGSALFRMGQFRDAEKAFADATVEARSDADRSRGLYNAGNAAYNEQSLEAALSQYQKALLTDPLNEDARFNYEFVKRRLEDQQQQQQQQGGQNQDDQQRDQNSQSSSGQQDQQQQNQGQEQQDSNQQGQDQQDQNQPQDGQEQQQPGQQSQSQPDPNALSREQAERILQALQGDEEQLLRQMQRQNTHPRNVEKDW